jgi:hypothetical protein
MQQAMACTQKYYSLALGEVENMDKSARPNDVQGGEAGQSMAWLCAEQIV